MPLLKVAVAREHEVKRYTTTSQSKIPRLLHMIWLGDREPPEYVHKHYARWEQLLPPCWNIMFWRNADVVSGRFSKETVKLIERAEKGAQKADILRMHIMKQFGGVYMDCDVEPARSLEDLLCEWPMARTFLCHDLDVTWNDIINGFFAAVPEHPIFVQACKLLQQATLNTKDIHLHTGPRILGEAVAQVNTADQVLRDGVVLLPIAYFYRNLDYPQRFGWHFYAKEW